MNAIAKSVNSLNTAPWTVNSRATAIKLMSVNFELTPDALTGILGTSIHTADHEYQDLIAALTAPHEKMIKRKQEVVEEFLKDWNEDSKVESRSTALQRLTSALSGADSLFYWGAKEIHAKMA